MSVRILIGDCRKRLRSLPENSVHTTVTSPPYFGLRDYGVEGQIGQEATPDEFVAAMVDVFKEVRRVLREDGTLWLNLGDSYARQGGSTDNTAKTRNRELGHMADTQRRMIAPPPGLKSKDLIGIPWRVAFALQADGWYLRSSIIWHKPNPMPESVTDRPTSAHENIFLLSKSDRYFYDHKAVQEAAVSDHPSGNGFKRDARKTYQNDDGSARGSDAQWKDVGGKRNLRNVWTIPTQPFSDAHFATFPPALIEPCIKAGSPNGGTVLDPFGGAGTTGLVADRLERDAILCELNPKYAAMAADRINQEAGMFATTSLETTP